MPTRQGIYVLTADGELLASVRPASADSVLATMQRGLHAWSARSAEGAESPHAPFSVAIGEDSYPAGGLVLELVVRDLTGAGEPRSRPAGSGTFPARSAYVPRAWNLDHVWFSRAEALQWIPREIEIGSECSLPEDLVARVVCLHLLDSVNGSLPRRFRPEDVRSSWIRTEVVALDGTLARLHITGRTRAHGEGRASHASANRMETRLLGDATFDLESQAFHRFEAVALGRCAEYRSPNSETATEPREIGFAFHMPVSGQERTPPLFLHRYDADWVNAGIHDTSGAGAVCVED
jgi:hypothetical protein